MLIETDINELGDKRLNPEEAVIREREALLTKASTHKFGRQDELEDPSRTDGPRLTHGEVIRRLRKIAPEIRAVDGSPGDVALYFPCTSEEYALKVMEHDPVSGPKDQFFLRYKYVGGFPKGELFEFSGINIDTSHLPTREKRGWRSVLISLLKQGVISYSGAVKQFGDVGTDRRGWRWTEQTKIWRNNPTKAFPQESLCQEQ